ncbi:MAG: hypothetical protein E6I89_16405 [Chloroflexi bacterium]|nr:MAG: hypothetical protein E6I89_16405 [Chloroflexota bacterium]
MNDLRSEIRAAFEKEQAANPPVANLRERIVKTASTQPRRETNLQWMAVAAAVVIGSLVVVGLMSSRQAHRSLVPAAHPTPSPIADYGPPPAGVPLFYAGDPKHPGWYIGFDWNGVPQGTIKLAQPIDGRLSQAPDGSSFAYSTIGKGGYQQFLDRLGQATASEPAAHYVSEMWADDSQHMCTLDDFKGQWTLGIKRPGEAPTLSSTVAIDPSIARSGILAIELRSCSLPVDRAVLVYNYGGRPTEVWVVRISNGAILYHQSHAANTLADIVASHDSILIAESSNQSTGYLMGGTAPNTTIRSVASNSPMLILDPTYDVVAFSHDNSLVLVTTTPWASGIKTHLAAIEIATGRVVWRYDGDQELAGVFTEPTGAAFAVMFQNPSDQTLHPTVYIAMVYIHPPSPAIPGTYLRP